MGLAQTGTGKTAAFGLPLLHRLLDLGHPPGPTTVRARILAPTRELIAQISKVVNGLPNDIWISGHTDSTGFQRGEYGNWELSSDRANSSRRALISAGVASDRITQVVGKADQEPLIEEDPSAPQNRRVSIVLRRTAGVLPPELQKK